MRTKDIRFPINLFPLCVWCVAAQILGGFLFKMIQDNFYPLYNYILAAKDLSDCDKIIFSILANLDRGKGCTMSNANIAKICGKSERTVIDSIGRLDKLGYITKQLTYTDKNNTLRVIKCTPIADICTPCEILHPMQESVDTPCENLHLPHAEICTPPLQDSAPKYKSNSIIDSIDNSIVVDNSDKKPKKADHAPPSLTTYIKQIKHEGDNLPDKHKELVKPYFAAISKEYGEEKLYDIMLKNLKFPPKIKEIIQICEWAESKNYDIQKVLLKFGNYEKKKRVKYTRLLVTLMGWKFTSEEVGKDATTININNQNLPVYAAKTF